MRFRLQAGRMPWYGPAGLALMLLFWALNWTLPGTRTSWCFFPMWFGYCLFVDALVYSRKGSSQISRGGMRYALLFILSAPVWWLFELLNRRVGNWVYLGRELFSDLHYVTFASLSFSTVIPAVFGTAELAGTLGPIKDLRTGPVIRRSPQRAWAMSLSGAACLALMLAWPRYFFPLMWVSVFLLVEPVNIALGAGSVSGPLSRGDWRAVAALSAGVLTCGFFWEMWNYLSFPKWVYNVPFVGSPRLFEMPIAGYAGYIPFSLELFAIYSLAVALAGSRSGRRMVEIIAEDG